MPSVTRSFTVHPAPAVVIDYLKDFANAEEWDPGTESCTRVDDGPIAVGARWHNVSKIAGVTTELDYELTELTDTRVVLVGRNDSATSTDTITVLPSGEGSEITYHADLDMHGLANLAAPAMKLVFEKLANDTEDQLTRALESR
ncbi:MAG: SRPBCC family protein [Terrabacter sp.]|nr:SRPBCC family protein [Terrabacter sp.]